MFNISDRIQDSMISMVARWLHSLAASLGSANGIMLILAVIAGLYLASRLSKKLRAKTGIGLGPILAICLLVAGVIGLRNGWGKSQKLHATLPPGIVKSKATKTKDDRQRLAALQRSQLSTAMFDPGFAAALPTFGMVLPAFGIRMPLMMPAMAAMRHPISPAGVGALAHRVRTAVHSATAVGVASPTASPARGMAGPKSATAPSTAKAAKPGATGGKSAGVVAGTTKGKGTSSGTAAPQANGGMAAKTGTAPSSGRQGNMTASAGGTTHRPPSRGRYTMTPDQIQALHDMDVMSNPFHPMHGGHMGGGHPGGAHPGMAGHGGHAGSTAHPKGHH